MPHRVVPPNNGLARMIASFFPEDFRGYAVDVGASDGISVNSTWWLDRQLQWTVINVEPNPEFWPILEKQRLFIERAAVASFCGTANFKINVDVPEAYSSLKVADRPEVRAYRNWKEIEVKVLTLDCILDKWEFPRLDVLCIDVEGTELDVLKGIDLQKWQPKIIVTECWDDESPIDSYLADRGYRKLPHTERMINNDFFERIDG